MEVAQARQCPGSQPHSASTANDPDPRSGSCCGLFVRIPEDSYPNILAMTFFIGIFAHYVIYALGIPVLRTLCFSLAALSTLALGLRVLDLI
jgi:hypothetical protein